MPPVPPILARSLFQAPRLAPFAHRLILLAVVVQALVLALNPSPVLHQAANLAVVLATATLLTLATNRPADFWILLVLGITAPVIDFAVPWEAALLGLNLLKVVLYIAFPAVLAWRIFVTIYDADAITPDEIAGAVAVYLLMGFVFANLYEAMVLVRPGSILWSHGVPLSTYGEFLYFSFITMATVGYGDVAPQLPAARFLVVLQAVTGTMYMAILVARFVSLHTTTHRRSPPPDRTE